jgi:hypothetical protein
MLQELKDIFANVNDLLRFAETKHGGVIAFNVAAVAVLCSLVFDKDKVAPHSLQMCLFLGAAALFVLATLVSLRSFLPVLSNKVGSTKKPSSPLNVVFFGHIRFFDTASYLLAVYEKIYGVPPSTKAWTKLDEDYANQIIVNSQITQRKFELFRTCGYITLLGLIVFLAGVLVIN